MNTGSAERPVGQQVSTTARKREKVNVNYECPPIGMTLKLCAQNGTCRLYASGKTRNPSKEVHDYELSAQKGECNDDFIPCREFAGNQTNGVAKRQANGREAVRVYVTIEGVEETNTFTLDTTSGDTSTPKGMLTSNSLKINIVYKI